MNTIVTCRSDASCYWVEDARPRRVIVWGPPASARPPAAAAARTALRAAALEHEARGLINLIVIASRCMEHSAEGDDREGWRWEIHAAAERLEALYRAGLPRNFLSGRCATPRDTEIVFTGRHTE